MPRPAQAQDRERWTVVLDLGKNNVKLSGVSDSYRQAVDQLTAVARAVFGEKFESGRLADDVFAVPGSDVSVRINHVVSRN